MGRRLRVANGDHDCPSAFSGAVAFAGAVSGQGFRSWCDCGTGVQSEDWDRGGREGDALTRNRWEGGQGGMGAGRSA